VKANNLSPHLAIESGSLRPDVLPPGRGAPANPAAAQAGHLPPLRSPTDRKRKPGTFVAEKKLTEIKKENEIASIASVLTDTQGNANQAARRLGISPQLINYKLKRYGIDRLSYRRSGSARARRLKRLKL
jgi:DNA-binding NtrC family response regulator